MTLKNLTHKDALEGKKSNNSTLKTPPFKGKL